MSNEHDLFLLWRTPQDVRFTRLAAGEQHIGRVLMNRPVSDMDVVWTGSHFIVVGVDATEQTVYGILLDRTNGAPVAPEVPLVKADYSASLARNANTILLRYTYGGLDHARRLTQTGQLVSDDEWFPGRDRHGILVARGSGFLDVTPKDGTMTVTTFDSNGALQAQTTLPRRDGAILGIAAASSPTDSLIVYGSSEGVVSGARVRPDGVVGVPFTITCGNALSQPATTVIWDGVTYDVAYTDTMSGETKILRVDAAGNRATAYEPPATSTAGFLAWPL